MSSELLRPMSESDKALLESYLRLTPSNREKVMAYLEALKASQCSPGPSGDSPR